MDVYAQFSIVNIELRLTEDGRGQLVANIGTAIGLKDMTISKDGERSPPIRLPEHLRSQDRYVLETAATSLECPEISDYISVDPDFSGCNDVAYLLPIAKARANSSKLVNGLRQPADCNQIPAVDFYPQANVPDGNIIFSSVISFATESGQIPTQCNGDNFMYDVDLSRAECATDSRLDPFLCTNPSIANWVIDHVDEAALFTRPWQDGAKFYCVDIYETTFIPPMSDYARSFIYVAWVRP